MVGKLFHSSNSELKDNSKIHFSQPKIDKNGVFKSEVYYAEEGKPKIEYQTDIFELPTGIQKSATGVKYLDMLLTQETSPFFDFMGEMDELAIGRIFQNRKKWFSEDMQLDQDTIDQYYKNLVRRGGNTTFIRFKVTPEVLAKNHYGHKVELEKVGIENKVQLRLLFDGLLFYNQLIIPEYVIQEIKCYDNKLDFKSFQNDFPTITSEKLNSAYETDFEGLLTATKEQTTAEDLANFDERNEGFVKENLEKTDQTTAEEIARFEEQNEAFISQKLKEDTLGERNGLNNVQNNSNEIDEMLAKTLSKANALENTENEELDDIENQVVFLLEKIKRMKESSKVSQTSQLRSNQSESEA
jgi:hypothetical protein